MSNYLVMPKFGLTMTEGKILKWHVEEGQEVKEGDQLYDVETDKLTNTVVAGRDGVVRKILVSEGNIQQVSAPVGIIADADEDIADLLEQAGGQSQTVEAAPETGGETTSKVVVIGGGPGGYVAAIRLAQLGKKVVLVEKNKLGGTCLNIGCIPTKALLHSASLYETIKNADTFGVDIEGEIKWNGKAAQQKKAEVVHNLVSGVEGLMRLNGVEVIYGEASFVSADRIRIKGEGGEQEVSFTEVIIATGSLPSIPPVPGFDLSGIMDSTDALSLEDVPKEIAIIGGGVIGVEFASYFHKIGAQVSIIEQFPYILPPIDGQVRELVKAKLEQQGVKVYTGSKVNKIEWQDKNYVVEFTSSEGEKRETYSHVLVATGRRAVVEGLDLDRAGIKTVRGHIEVDDQMRTNVKHIYAIGDVVGKNMLAHVASEQGMVAAETIAGRDAHMDYDLVPACVYATPEIASVGLTEEAAKEKGLDYQVGLFPLASNGKAQIDGDTDGAVIKIISDKKYNEILGVHMFGEKSTELIAECTLAMKLECTLEELIATIHAHPTVSEAVREAAMATFNEHIHG